MVNLCSCDFCSRAVKMDRNPPPVPQRSRGRGRLITPRGRARGIRLPQPIAPPVPVQYTMEPPLIGIGRGEPLTSIVLPCSQDASSGAQTVCSARGFHYLRPSSATVAEPEGAEAIVAVPLIEVSPQDIQLGVQPRTPPPSPSRCSRSTQMSPPRYRCLQCGRRFRYLFEFREHQNYCTPVHNARCLQCRQWFHSRDALREHQRFPNHVGREYSQ